MVALPLFIGVTRDGNFPVYLTFPEAGDSVLFQAWPPPYMFMFPRVRQLVTYSIRLLTYCSVAFLCVKCVYRHWLRISRLLCSFHWRRHCRSTEAAKQAMPAGPTTNLVAQGVCWRAGTVPEPLIRSTSKSRPNNIRGGKMSVRTSVRPSTKSFFDFNEIWYTGRGRWVMHDGMPYGRIQGQGQGHEPLKVWIPSIFKTYLLRHLQ